jgi:DNA-binding NtrC family response regulator
MSRILVVDDEASICWAFRESLSDLGHHVDIASSAEEGLTIAAKSPFDAVVLDVRLPGIDGLSAMHEFRARLGRVPIIVVTAFGDLDTAVKAVEGGAFDYLVKPFDLSQATAALTRALDPRRHGAALAASPEPETDGLIGKAPVMQELFKRIALVAPTNVPVLITGESGTGKELVARAIHRHSARKNGPLLPVCLAALSPSVIERELFGHLKGSFTGALQDRKGLFELAGGGSVLLDEIGDVSPSLQVKLLRAIEHGEVTPVGDARPRPIDIRVIAATNRPLHALLASGEFREDLFYRLSVFQIEVPRLGDRREDIPALAQHFLRRARPGNASLAPLGQDVLDELQRRPWTGNVRELRNAIEYAAIVARGDRIRQEHLPAATAKTETEPRSDRAEIQGRLAAWTKRALRAPGPETSSPLYERFLELAEPAVLRALVEECGRNRGLAAQALGIHRATLRGKLRKYGID